MLLPDGVRRALALFLLPFGLVCLAVPFYLFAQPERRAILTDTRAVFGGGREAGPLKAVAVGCTGTRSGSSSNTRRSTGMTEYECVIDLDDTPAAAPASPLAAPPAGTADPYAGLDHEAAMAKYRQILEEQRRAMDEQSRLLNESIASLSVQARDRSESSNRLERTLAVDKSGRLPTVRLFSAEGEPRRVGLDWGGREIAWRWLQLLGVTVLFWGFGAALLLPAKLMFRRKGSPPKPAAAR